jgi:hypothetical protein
VARVGSFTGMAGGPYGAALGTVHPADNRVPTEASIEAENLLHDIPGVETPRTPTGPGVPRGSPDSAVPDWSDGTSARSRYAFPRTPTPTPNSSLRR